MAVPPRDVSSSSSLAELEKMIDDDDALTQTRDILMAAFSYPRVADEVKWLSKNELERSKFLEFVL